MKSLLLTSLLLLTLAFAGEPIRVSKINLEDQHEKTHTVSFPAAAPAFVAVADRAASEPMKQWTLRCKQEFGTNVQYVAIADVRKVPALLRGFIRKKFQKAYPHPVLLDWSGATSDLLHARAGVPNIYILSKKGDLIAVERGEFSAEKMERLKSSIPR